MKIKVIKKGNTGQKDHVHLPVCRGCAPGGPEVLGALCAGLAADRVARAESRWSRRRTRPETRGHVQSCQDGDCPSRRFARGCHGSRISLCPPPLPPTRPVRPDRRIRLSAARPLGMRSRTLVDSLYAEPLLRHGMERTPAAQAALESEMVWMRAGRYACGCGRTFFFHDGTPLTAGTVAASLNRRRRRSGFGVSCRSRRKAIDVVIVSELKSRTRSCSASSSTGRIKTGEGESSGNRAVHDPQPRARNGARCVQKHSPRATFDLRKVIVRTYENSACRVGRGSCAATSHSCTR